MVCTLYWQPGRIVSSLMFLLALCASGCAIPVSEHPLSDETNSVLDERLIGHWDFLTNGENGAEPIRIVVGQHPKHNTLHEYASVSLDSQKHLEVQRNSVMVTKNEGARYLSMVAGEPGQGYTIMRYDYQPGTADSHDTVSLHVLVDNFIAAAIDKGELAGKVTREKDSGRLQEVRITAKPEELRAFIEKHPDKCFSPDAVKLVRVNKP